MMLKLLCIVLLEMAKITLTVCIMVGKFVCDVNVGNHVSSFFVYV